MMSDKLCDPTTLDAVLAVGGVTSVFQPIIDLDSGAVVAYEALARGPVGPLRSPRTRCSPRPGRPAGWPSWTRQCRAAAFRGARSTQGLLAPLTVFVNVEPEVLDSAPLGRAAGDRARPAPAELRVVVEITERAIAARPAELLQHRAAHPGDRLGPGPGRRRRGRDVAGVHAAAAARRGQAGPAPGAGPAGPCRPRRS
jgi:EAL domain-containing protein (putative c-di-GMP-specific phosphodiesterase class I)